MIELPDLESLGGLKPRTWICAGSGFSREDVKSLLLSKGIAFTGDAIQSFQSLCQRVLKAAGGPSGASPRDIHPRDVLQSPARQEVLRLLLSVAGLKERFTELKRLKRQGAFLRRLDSAIQAGRMAFAHWEEAEVYSARLEQKAGPSGAGLGAVRREIEVLARAYEDWLTQSGYWDPPLLARKAVEVLNAAGPAELRTAFPETIYHLSAQSQESLELSFWEALGRHTRVVKLGPQAGSAKTDPVKTEMTLSRFEWKRWHTLDDAAEALVDELRSAFSSLRDTVVLISDVPSSRRSLRRALEQAGIPLSDPRDPTRIRWDETVKWALLPLETVARGFERSRVIALLQTVIPPASQKPEYVPECVREILDRGIRNGLNAYAGGKLSFLHRELQGIAERFGGKKTARELAEAHLGLLERQLDHQLDHQLDQTIRDLAPGLKTPDGVTDSAPGGENTLWVLDFFERLWKQLVEDIERVGLGERRAAALYWFERLQSRVSESQAPVERLKPMGGLDVYRLHQAPPKAYARILVFGLPPLWLTPNGAGAGVGDYWFSERERELLAGEFAVRSGMQVRRERIELLRCWLQGAKETVFLDASYDPDGRERESILPVLDELARAGAIARTDAASPFQPIECGSHSRWLPSYGALRPIPPQQAKLEPLGPPEKWDGGPAEGKHWPVISASALENYSRCGFLALARSRWRLEDLSEPDADLWPQVKGILLHEAVRLLVESREVSSEISKDGECAFGKTVEEAIDLAWRSCKAGRPRGLLRGARIEAYVKRKLADLLRVFVEQERKYARRSGTRVIGLEDVEFEVEYGRDHGKFSIVGEPDRIDEHPDGLWIIDYKTSSQAPNGSVMLENGYRLQLPFYALAAQRKFGKPALGFQFVQLDRKGTRVNGVYFKPHNGKEPGKLTDTTARSKSLLNLPREEVWARFEREIEEQGARYVSGIFEAMPRISPRSKECASCGVSDFCGYRRLMEEEADA